MEYNTDKYSIEWLTYSNLNSKYAFKPVYAHFLKKEL